VLRTVLIGAFHAYKCLLISILDRIVPLIIPA
jgi:hypothetical protein